MAKITVADLCKRKIAGEKFSLITCYDYTMAKILSKTDIDILLVGDSAAQMALGENTTLSISLDVLIALTRAVRRGAPEKMVVADMPFMSYQPSLEIAMKNAGRFVSEAEADVVKIEAGRPHIDIVKAVSDCGISVMAHIGLRPQTIGLKGQLKAEGMNAVASCELIKLACDMERAGAGSLLIEGTSREVVEMLCKEVSIPTISCGAGPACDGQVLVINDVLGMFDGKAPKFARRYADIPSHITEAINAYHKDVCSGQYPSDQECYHIKTDELEMLKRILSEL